MIPPDPIVGNPVTPTSSSLRRRRRYDRRPVGVHSRIGTREGDRVEHRLRSTGPSDIGSAARPGLERDGDDMLTGGLGADTIDGGAGDDTIHYTVGDGVDIIDGGTQPG